MEVYSIKAGRDNGYTVRLNPKHAAALGMENKFRCCIGYGIQKCYAEIGINSDVQEDEIVLSQKVIDYLYLPEYPDFEVRSTGEELMIGPHIGIILCRQGGEITKARLDGALKFIPEYSRLHGSVIVFAQDKIDMPKHMIEGYCYNHRSKDYVRGIFPYPLSIYLKILLDTDVKNHLLSVIGNTLFNNFFLGKYEMHRWLSKDQSLIPHLPQTVLYKSGKDVFSMLKHYGRVYVKSNGGECGKEVAMISIEYGRIAVRYRSKKNNVEYFIEDFSEAGQHIENLFVPSKFVVQQPVDLLTYDGRPFDFRQVIQKGVHGSWMCKGIIGRIAARGSVVSNISNGGQAMWAADLLKRVPDLPDDKACVMVDEMNDLGLRICRVLDKQGVNFGDLGIDLGIDKTGHIWVIEVNNHSPDAAIALFVNDKPLYKDLVSAQLLYAKFLAGFGEPV